MCPMKNLPAVKSYMTNTFIPVINSIFILVSNLENFWSNVGVGADEAGHFDIIIDEDLAQTKVCDLDESFSVFPSHQDVFQLEVPVAYSLLVHVLQK